MYDNIVRMTGKLTLSVDPEVIRRAKREAKKYGTSVSRMVEVYLDLVSRTPEDKGDPPILGKLRGSLKRARAKDYRRYLEIKYR